MIVLIHGPFNPIWLEIAKFEPRHNFIISTWPSMDIITTITPNVTIVTNVDPGDASSDTNNRNLNRFITSVKSVLSLISDSDIVLRIRSDANIRYTIGDYENLWHEQYHQWTPCKSYKVFDQKMIIGEYYTAHPDSTLNLHYHPGDWFSISTGKDLKKFWSHIPLRTDVDKFSILRTEQYLWLNCLKHFYPNLPTISKDVEENNVAKEASTLALLNNFIVYSNNKIGIWVKKYPHALSPHPEMFTQEYLKGN